MNRETERTRRLVEEKLAEWREKIDYDWPRLAARRREREAAEGDAERRDADPFTPKPRGFASFP